MRSVLDFSRWWCLLLLLGVVATAGVTAAMDLLVPVAAAGGVVLGACLLLLGVDAATVLRREDPYCLRTPDFVSVLIEVCYELKFFAKNPSAQLDCINLYWLYCQGLAILCRVPPD